MRVDDFHGIYKPFPLKFALEETPHATIEANRTCNMRCSSCYTLNKHHVKPPEEVKAEIDLLRSKRKLDTITLLGGEPTLYPDLVEIIRYIKEFGIKCQLLSNGLVLYHDKYDSFLAELVDSGIDRILLHIDCGQRHMYDDISRVRHSLSAKLERRKIHFSFSITIFENNEHVLSEIIEQFARYRYFDGILAVLAKEPRPPFEQNTKLIDQYSALRTNLGLNPVAYIPFSLDENEVSWLIYYFFFNACSNLALQIPPYIHKILRKFYAMLHQRQLFSIIFHPSLYIALFLFTGFMSALRQPHTLISFTRMFFTSSFGSKIRFYYIAIQSTPKYDEQFGDFTLCYHCPDATIRNGKLTPVCIADLINPFEEDVGTIEIQKELRDAVYTHLEEM